MSACSSKSDRQGNGAPTVGMSGAAGPALDARAAGSGSSAAQSASNAAGGSTSNGEEGAEAALGLDGAANGAANSAAGGSAAAEAGGDGMLADAGAVPSMPADPGSGVSSPDCAAPLLPLSHPNPLLSRAARVFSSPAGGQAVVDGQYHNGGWFAGSPNAAAPAWVALELPVGPTRVLVSWDDGGTYNYEDPISAMVYGLPGSYRIEVSPDSTNGSDGAWTEAVSITGNQVRTRAHAIDFTGQRWVKLSVTAAPPNAANGVSIAEIDVHDLSADGSCLPEDTWFFMGDSITAFAYDRAAVHQPSFAAGINAASPAFFPAMINGGIGGETTVDGLARVGQALALNPDFRFFVLGYGTNDAGNGVPLEQFRSNLQSMIDQIEAAGRTPILPHIPFSGDGGHTSVPSYNAVIDQLTQQKQLRAGPDLFTYFESSPDLFICPPCVNGRMTDRLHPNDTGLLGMSALWTSAMRALYP